MLKNKLLVICFILSSNVLFSNGWIFNTELFFIESGTYIKDDTEWGFDLGLPTLHFTNDDLNLNISLETGKIKIKDYSYGDLSLGKAGIMYGLIMEENVLLGPFANVGLKSINNPSLETNVGFRLHSMYSLGFFDHIPLSARMVKTEFGYSIDENRFFFNISADPIVAVAMIGYMFGAGEYKDATGEEYDPDEIQKDDPFREDFK